MINEKDFKNMCKLNEFKECIKHPHVEDVYFERCKTYFAELILFNSTKFMISNFMTPNIKFLPSFICQFE